MTPRLTPEPGAVLLLAFYFAIIVFCVLAQGCGKGANYSDCAGPVVCYDDECRCTKKKFVAITETETETETEIKWRIE